MIEQSQAQVQAAARPARLRQLRMAARARPGVIGNWILVAAIESFILIALTPALVNRFGPPGWIGLAIGGLLALFAFSWRIGHPIGHTILIGLHMAGIVALLVAVGAFLSAQPPLTAVIFLALAYIGASAYARGERAAGITLSIVLVIGFVVLFASAPAAARPRLNLMLALFGFYTLASGAAMFIFGAKFADLGRPDVLAFFGRATAPAALTSIAAGQVRLRRLLARSYRLLSAAIVPVRRSLGSGRAALVGRVQAMPAHSRRVSSIALAILVLLFFPLLVRWVEQVSNLSLLITMNVGLIFVVLTLGLNIVVGFAGLLDLGYAAFFAIGAYTVGIFTWPNLGLEWSFWVVIWISTVMAAIFGMIIGAPTLRLRGDYLAIVTLAFGEIVPRAIRELWDIRIRIPFTEIYLIGSKLEGFNLTNGPQGMNPVGRPYLLGHEIGVDSVSFLGLTISPPMQWYFLIALVGALVLFASFRLEHSRLGRAWMAVREDETAADTMGVDPIRTKLLAFALGASFSGLAGSIYAAMIQAIFPELFSFLVSIFLLILVIVSGMGNIWGVLMGGIFISLFDRVVLAQIVPQYVPGGDVLQRWRWVMYAAGLIAVMVLRPEGLFPSAARRAELHAAEEEELAAEEFAG